MDLLEERKEVIDRVASQVAEEGPALEERLRAGNNPLYDFLNPYPYCRSEDAHQYYRHKLELEIILQEHREHLLAR